MEYVAGGRWPSDLRGCSSDAAAALVEPLARAVHHAHDAGSFIATLNLPTSCSVPILASTQVRQLELKIADSAQPNT